MSVSLIIDNRESKLKCLFQDFPCSNLEHGDFQIHYDDKILLVIERKTIADLYASINDGRYKNQKVELLSVYSSNMIYYIIEGNVDKKEKTLMSCIINMMIRDNIKVFITKDVNDTYDLIDNIYRRIKEDPNKYIGGENHLQVIKSKNKDLTRKKMFELQLCQIPSISQKTALAICDKYSNLKTFLDTLKDFNNAEKLKALKEITHNNNKKISGTSAENIIKYMFEDGS